VFQHILSPEDKKRLHTGNNVYYSPLMSPASRNGSMYPQTAVRHSTLTTQLSLRSLFKHTNRFVSLGLCFPSNMMKLYVTYTKLRPPWLFPYQRHNTNFPLMQPCFSTTALQNSDLLHSPTATNHCRMSADCPARLSCNPCRFHFVPLLPHSRWRGDATDCPIKYVTN
jgi:hypothetical protein